METKTIPVDPNLATTLDGLGEKFKITRVFGLVEYDTETKTWTPIPGCADLEVNVIPDPLNTAVIGVKDAGGKWIGTLVRFQR